jgi:hypothetical protein
MMKFDHMRGAAAFLQPNTGVTLPPPAWHRRGIVAADSFNLADL